MIEHVTCLGCGCACDDIGVVVTGRRIVEARRACEMGIAWFGDGAVPAGALASGRESTVGKALGAAARMLVQAETPVIYLAPDLTCEAQREGVALADLLHATIDSVTSGTAMRSVLASQERGRAAATLGEVRNRGDVIVFWGVDPKIRYPRYASRYAPEPAGIHVPDGRRSRRVVAVDVSDANGGGANCRGPADADLRLSIRAEEEVATLTALRALVTAQKAIVAGRDGAPWELARQLAPTLLGARYAVLVHDAEPVAGRDPGGTDALIALAQALNGPTRCALSTLRGGGNRSGADSVMTSQTGFPAVVDFARGYPRYRPHDGSTLTRLVGQERATGTTARVGTVAVLVIGAAARIPAQVLAAIALAPCSVVGPRATESPLALGVAAIDSGVAGIHEGGTALRMDDVPLPLRPSLDGPPDAASLVRLLRERIALSLPRTAQSPVPET